MNTLIIYTSIHHGNTEKVAKAMADVMNARLVKVDEIEPSEILEYDLIGFGSGIFSGKHHRSILKFVDDIPLLENKNVFIFYTSGFEKFPILKPFDSKLNKKLLKKEASIVGCFSCRGWETYGPFAIGGGKNKGQPNEEDIRQAEEFARSLLE